VHAPPRCARRAWARDRCLLAAPHTAPRRLTPALRLLSSGPRFVYGAGVPLKTTTGHPQFPYGIGPKDEEFGVDGEVRRFSFIRYQDVAAVVSRGD
jgi:hypothetical protein